MKRHKKEFHKSHNREIFKRNHFIDMNLKELKGYKIAEETSHIHKFVEATDIGITNMDYGVRNQTA